MNDKKQRYNTIQKPYNNKYHNNNEKPRLITSYMDEQHNISPYHTTTKGNSTNEKSSFYKCPFFISEIYSWMCISI